MRFTLALAASMTMVSALTLKAGPEHINNAGKKFVLEKPNPKWNTNENAAKKMKEVLLPGMAKFLT